MGLCLYSCWICVCVPAGFVNICVCACVRVRVLTGFGLCSYLILCLFSKKKEKENVK